MSLARVRITTAPETGGPPELRVDGKSLALDAVTELRLVMRATGPPERRGAYACQGVEVVGQKVSIRHVCPIRGTL